MTVVSCPLCDYETDDVSDTIAAVLLSTHAISHQPGATSSSAKVERVKRPVISSAGISEDWNYFLSRWNDYIEATKVTGKDGVLQLLEYVATRNSVGTSPVWPAVASPTKQPKKPRRQ